MKGDTMEKKTIKLYDGIKVCTEDGTTTYPDMTALDAYNIQEEYKLDVIRHLMAFGTLDLTEAYRGRKVVFTLYKE